MKEKLIVVLGSAGSDTIPFEDIFAFEVEETCTTEVAPCEHRLSLVLKRDEMEHPVRVLEGTVYGFLIARLYEHFGVSLPKHFVSHFPTLENETLMHLAIELTDSEDDAEDNVMEELVTYPETYCESDEEVVGTLPIDFEENISEDERDPVRWSL